MARSLPPQPPRTSYEDSGSELAPSARLSGDYVNFNLEQLAAEYEARGDGTAAVALRHALAQEDATPVAPTLAATSPASLPAES